MRCAPNNAWVRYTSWKEVSIEHQVLLCVYYTLCASPAKVFRVIKEWTPPRLVGRSVCGATSNKISWSNHKVSVLQWLLRQHNPVVKANRNLLTYKQTCEMLSSLINDCITEPFFKTLPLTQVTISVVHTCNSIHLCHLYTRLVYHFGRLLWLFVIMDDIACYELDLTAHMHETDNFEPNTLACT